MHRTRLFLGVALTLSVLTLASRLATRPAVALGSAGATVSSGGLVELALRPAHRALRPQGTDLDVAVTVTANREAPRAPQPVSMALVIDTSGSMATEKMEQARAAARRLVQLADARDSLAVVRFSTDASSLALRRMDGDGKAEALRFIERMTAEGGTNIDLALARGREALSGATGVRRLVLISDGEPTVGITADEPLESRAEQLHADAIAVTALGVGHDFRSVLMKGLAERGGGFYGYLENAEQLETVLEQELAQARGTTGRNVELELALAPGVSLLEVPGRRVTARGGGRHVIGLPDLGPGAQATVYLQLRVPEASGATEPVLTATLAWTAIEGEVMRAELALALPVVDGEAAFLASRDEAVFTDCVRARGTQRTVAAAAAYERGDTSTALSLLDSARGIFGMSADALAGEAPALDHARHQFNTVSDPGARSRYGKDMEKKGMKSFGENNGY